MEDMYEVLRFIDHGAGCRQSMDCVSGTLLPDYLRSRQTIGKEQLFEWFRQLAAALDQFHRCRGQQNYRYLNPYSILVSEEGNLLLLDLESPENEFVMRKLQKNSMRSHFVKPVYDMGIVSSSEIDLFSYGKTIQFILAYTKVSPALSRWEEIRLERLIGRCMGKKKKKYEDFRQVIRDLPREKTYAVRKTRQIIIAAAAGTGVAASALFSRSMYQNSIAADTSGQVRQQEEQDTEQKKSPEQKEEPLSDLEILQSAGSILTELEEENTEEGYETVIAAGSMLELELERCLAKAYMELDRKEEACQVYGRLIQIEDVYEKIEEAGVNKMTLESGEGEFALALETGQDVLERIGSSSEIEEMMEKCTASLEEESGAGEEQQPEDTGNKKEEEESGTEEKKEETADTAEKSP